MRFLHLEDNLLDAELIETKLKEHWPGCSVTLAVNEVEFSHAIASNGIELILADYSLPGFSGMEALRIASAMAPEIPFIFVSGSMGEEIAIESLKSGATDYVLKNRLARLLPAISRALQERDARLKRKEAEELLAANQLQLEELNSSLKQRIEETVAELRQKDALLIQQSRHAAIGELLRNIAHHWRQPLNNIGLILQNLQQSNCEKRLTDAELENDVQLGMKILEQLSSTIQNFSSFFHVDTVKRLFTANIAVRKAMDLVNPTLAENNITVDFDEDPDCMIDGYPNECIQAVHSILVNAREVLLERKSTEPRISIRISCDEQYTTITISDNAGGIPEELLPKIFDPYCTTKGVSSGLGLGLYMARSIVEKSMGGSITVANINNGACFTLKCPSSDKSWHT
jgi:signal transduction histidine kinase